MTSKERNAAARGRFAFGVIPGRAQREPGSASPTAKLVIQWHLRDARLDPGSALRAVRDDIKKRVSGIQRGKAQLRPSDQVNRRASLSKRISWRSRRGVGSNPKRR